MAILLASAAGLAAPAGVGPSSFPLDEAAFGASVEEGRAALASFGPRGEGGPGEAAATDWLAARLRALGLSPDLEALSDLPGDQSDARALSIRLAGSRPERLVLLLPLDNHPDAAPGEGDAGLALMVAELGRLGAALRAGRVLPLDLEVVFLPADRRGPASEDRSEGPGPAWWIDRKDSAEPTALVYLAISRIPRRLELRNADRGLLSPWWLFDRAQGAVRGAGIELEVHPNRMQGYRLGLLPGGGPLAPFLQGGIPSVELRDSPGGGRGEAAAFARLVEGLLEGNASGFPEDWDRDYSSFRLGSLSLEVREGPYVVFLLCFSAGVAVLVLSLSLRKRHLIPLYVSKLPHRLLNLGLLGLLALGAVLLSLACVGLESLLLGSPRVWSLAPGLFAASRLLMSLFSFLCLLSFAVARRLISPDPWFYELAALVIFGLDILLFAFLSLPLSLYFCWGFLVVLSSLLLRRKWAGLLAFPLMLLPVALVVGALFAMPESSALALIVSPDVGRGLLLALVLLPYATMSASPLLFFAPRGLRRRRAAGLLFLGLALAAEALPLLFVAPKAARAPLSLVESFDQDRGSWSATVDSPARLGSLRLERAGQIVELDSRSDRALLAGSDDSKPLALRSRFRPFLDRESSSISLVFPRPPASIRLRLVSSRPLTIYDCSLPYRVDLDGLGADIFVGPGKGKSLEFGLTTDSAFAGDLEVEALFAGPVAPWKLDSPRPFLVGESRVKASFPLGPGR